MLEAMALSKVVITTNSNDYSELLGANENGIVINSFDSEIIANKISNILIDTFTYTDIGKRANLKAQGFLWGSVADKISSWMNHYG